jgi:class 3 adenylate cyclase
LAGPGDVLVSGPTASLLEGAGLQLEDAGEHELKGLAGARRIYRLLGA